MRLKNLAKFTDFEMEFDGRITRLVGMNGSGKTTIGLTAIWAGLKGIAEKSSGGQLVGERFRFIGSKKMSADIELDLVDEKMNGAVITIKNHITKNTNKITFEAPAGYKIDTLWLDNLLNVAFISAKHFGSLDSKEQALLLGINTEKIDAEIVELKTEYTVLNREFKSFGEIKKVPVCERVEVARLVLEKSGIRDKLNAIYLKNKAANDVLRKKQKDDQAASDEKIRLFNAEQTVLDSNIEKAKECLRVLASLGYKGSDVSRFVLSLGEAQELKKFEVLPDPTLIQEVPDDAPVQEIDKKISEATAINEQALTYESYLKQIQKKNDANTRMLKNKEAQEIKETERLDYIKTFQFGFDGLEVGEKGELLLSGRPVKEPYFSKGELEIIVAKLYSSINPMFKVRFIDDFELIDEDNQKKILDFLFENGFQVVTAEVGKQSKGDNCIVLRECQISNGEPKKTELI